MSQTIVPTPEVTDLPAGTWEIDPVHSSVEFSVRHLMVSKVKGRFARFSGTITVAPDPLGSSVRASIDVTSVDTHDDKRDAHLRSGDFFDIEKYPTIEFESTSIEAGPQGHVVKGDLTIAGVTRPVRLDLEYNGTGGDPYGGTRAGFSATTEISRKDFGMTYNAALETGGVMVGDSAKISLEIEAVKQ